MEPTRPDSRIGFDAKHADIHGDRRRLMESLSVGLEVLTYQISNLRWLARTDHLPKK
jgi:hypothetical protein